jgi:hypothetical protein
MVGNILAIEINKKLNAVRKTLIIQMLVNENSSYFLST